MAGVWYNARAVSLPRSWISVGSGDAIAMETVEVRTLLESGSAAEGAFVPMAQAAPPRATKAITMTKNSFPMVVRVLVGRHFLPMPVETLEYGMVKQIVPKTEQFNWDVLVTLMFSNRNR